MEDDQMGESLNFEYRRSAVQYILSAQTVQKVFSLRANGASRKNVCDGRKSLKLVLNAYSQSHLFLSL